MLNHVLIKPLAQCATKPADSKNGMYIVTEKWNTCFHRWRRKVDSEIRIEWQDTPSAFRTYTKISWNLRDHIYFVYVNLPAGEGFTLFLKGGGSIIGMYDPQYSGKYMNYAFLVYLKDRVDGQVEVRQTGKESADAAWLVQDAQGMSPEPVLIERAWFQKDGAPCLFFRPQPTNYKALE